MRRKRRKQGRPRGSVAANGRWAWGTWWAHGQRVRKNLKVPLSDPDWRQKAEDALKVELAKVDLNQGSVARGSLVFEQLRELVVQDYTRHGRRSLARVEYSFARLAEHFAGKKVEEINEPALDGYVDARLAQVKSGTVRLELAALKRGLALAAKKKLISASEVPNIPALPSGDAREGFLEDDAFLQLVGFLPEYLRGVAWIGFLCGMRRGEILSLTWANVDIKAKVIRLNRTKNGKRRLLAYGKLPELVAVMEGQHKARMALAEPLSCPWVFHHGGKPIRDFRHAWKVACAKAGKPDTIFHDLRRCGVRGLVRKGVPDVIAMRISGHESRSVFDRYNIVSESDIEDALGRVTLGHSSAIEPKEGTR
jgi:integrase